MEIALTLLRFGIILFVLWLIGRAVKVLKGKWDNYNSKLDKRLKSYESLSEGIQSNIQQLINTQKLLTNFSTEMIEESRSLRTIAIKQQFEVKALKKSVTANNNAQNRRIEKIEIKIDNITEQLRLKTQK